MTITTTLAALQDSAATIMTADNFFNGSASTNNQPIPIVTENKGDIQTQILTALGSVGICALIVTPLFEFHEHLIQDLSGWAFMTVTIYEDAVVNQSSQGTGISAIALAEEVVSILHWAPHGVPTAATFSEPRFLGIERPIEFVSNGPPLQYNVSFQAHVTLNPVAT